MSQELKKELKKWIGILAIAGGLFGGGTAWTVLPYRIDALEQDNKTLKQQFTAQQKQIADLETTLARIDERTKNTAEDIKELARHFRIPTKD